MGQRSLKLILIFQPMFVCGVQMKSTLLQPTLGGEAGENYVHCITTKHSHGCKPLFDKYCYVTVNSLKTRNISVNLSCGT